MPWLREVPGGVALEILVQPRASRTRVVGEHDGRLKVQLAAPAGGRRGQRGRWSSSWRDALGVRRRPT